MSISVRCHIVRCEERNILDIETDNCVSLTWTSCCSSSCSACCHSPGWHRTCRRSRGDWSRPPPCWRRGGTPWPAPWTCPRTPSRAAWSRWEVACSDWRCWRDNPWSSLEQCSQSSHPGLLPSPLSLFLTWPHHHRQTGVFALVLPTEMSECWPWLSSTDL